MKRKKTETMRSAGLDEKFMRAALVEAGKAAAKGEVPVGAVVVRDGRIIGRGHNLSIAASDPTAHAEIVALRKAARRTGSYRLTGARIYVTIEPCPMCAGALVWARVADIVYGAADPKAGACGTLMDVAAHPGLNHRCRVVPGVLAAESRALIQDFFRSKRKRDRKQ